MATRAAVSEFVRVYNDPEGTQTRGAFQTRAGRYIYLWQYYTNAAFEELAGWGAYKGQHHLYRHTRSIYNPVRRLVDFYGGIVYPGYLTSDAMPLPDGTPCAIPISEDTSPALRAALGQLWQWSNWQIGKSLLVRYGAALGDVLLEVIDDTERGKVTLDVTWPGLVRDLELDMYGNVKSYTIEYEYEEDDRTYTYTRMVDSESVRTLRNGQPYAYSEAGAEYANPYGFVPACWVQHTVTGGEHGDPAVRNIAAIDELNSLAAHTLDQAHRILETPILISGERIDQLEANNKNDSTASLDVRSQRQESIKLLRGSAGAGVHTLRLDPGEALANIERLLANIEADHPELSMYNQLRSMGELTGPAADRLLGDVQTYVDAARASYDTQSVKAFQMAVAIGGWRAQRGDWGPRPLLSRQQQAFAPFDLDSYQAGDLDMEIMPRPLVAITERERLEIERLRAAVQMETQPQAATVTAGIADRLRVAGSAPASEATP